MPEVLYEKYIFIAALNIIFLYNYRYVEQRGFYT